MCTNFFFNYVDFKKSNKTYKRYILVFNCKFKAFVSFKIEAVNIHHYMLKKQKLLIEYTLSKIASKVINNMQTV